MPIVPTGKDEIVFLKNIKQLPAFPVLWLDEGADIDQVNFWYLLDCSIFYIR